ncbi:hypothetical protein BDN70DRAFT_920351 [Pholiota conissans]|uniref:Uncharacterized protein n=1 Tax=Pholiota conissans TaxID=109636 RepID=A0A9P5Z4H4_9AGAR|nr:hypothetical protein BDN70DRAFT_920351 [Pholiota conissans]
MRNSQQTVVRCYLLLLGYLLVLLFLIDGALARPTEPVQDLDLSDYYISHIHQLRKVTVPTCAGSANPININAAPYTRTDTLGYFDLNTPGDLNLNSDYALTPDLRWLVLTSMEESMYMSCKCALWNSQTTPFFCPWARTYLTTPYFPNGNGNGNGQSVVESLQRCLPANTNDQNDLDFPAGGQMAWLEGIAAKWSKGIREHYCACNAIAGQTFRSQKTFNDYAPVKQIAVFRSCGMYAEEKEITHIADSDIPTCVCVSSTPIASMLKIWTKDPNRPAGLNLGAIDWDNLIDNLYTDWIDQLLLSVHANIVNFLQDMTDWYVDPQVDIPLDYAGNLRTQGAQGIAKSPVTQAVLQAVTDRVANQPITWRVLL